MCFKKSFVMVVVFPSVSDVKQLALYSPCCRYKGEKKMVNFQKYPYELSLGNFFSRIKICIILIRKILSSSTCWMRNIYKRRKVVSGRFYNPICLFSITLLRNEGKLFLTNIILVRLKENLGKRSYFKRNLDYTLNEAKL